MVSRTRRILATRTLGVLVTGFVMLQAASSVAAKTAIVAASASASHVPTQRLKPRLGAARAGTKLSQRDLFGTRVFTTSEDGFALATYRSATYPASTHNGGQSWRVDGPQLHVNAADAAQAVQHAGALTGAFAYAYGGSVVDVTTNAGKIWWEAFFQGQVLAVVSGSKDELVALVQPQKPSSPILRYVLANTGRSWQLTRQPDTPS